MDLDGHKELCERLHVWFRRLGLEPDLSGALIVDMADFLEAAESLRASVENATSSNDTEVDFNSVVDINVLLQGELRWHLKSLRKLWPQVVGQLDED
ncbi:MAG: hypothetical protein ACR2GQ_04395 [Gemmatimonadota bacterium]